MKLGEVSGEPEDAEGNYTAVREPKDELSINNRKSSDVPSSPKKQQSNPE
jgi:hypothetical protein